MSSLQELEAVSPDPLQEDPRKNPEPKVAKKMRENGNQGQHLQVEGSANGGEARERTE